MDMVWFWFSNLFKSCKLTGYFIPSIFKVFSFSFNFLSNLCGFFSQGFNALRTHHKNHLLSSFFGLIIAFLLASSLGNGTHVSHLRGLYLTVCNSNRIILCNLHPLPVACCKAAIFSIIFYVIVM